MKHEHETYETCRGRIPLLFEFGFKRLLICTIQFGSKQSKANGYIAPERKPSIQNVQVK